MLPYTLIVLVAWTVFFVVWYLLGIPFGPGYPGPALGPRAGWAGHERRRRSASSSSAGWSRCSSGTGFPVELVAIGAALTLWATGVLDLDQALAGFGDPTVIFIASLFVVSEALDATGVTAWAGQQLIARVGESRTRLIVLMLLLVAGVTALISVNGAVAALLPVVVVIGGAARPLAVAAADAARLRARTPARCSRSPARP